MQSRQSSRWVSFGRRLLFWLVVVLFAALCIWWSLHFSYDADLMRRAIPPYATVVTQHRDLASRWPAIVRHPVVDAVLQAADTESDGVRATIRDPQLAAWISRLTGEQTLTAYVPANTPGAPVTGFIAVSWVGPYGQLLRWGFLNRAISGFEPARARDGTRIWRMRDASFPAGHILSLSACEGIALMCLSPDQDAASYLRARVACRARAIDRFAGPLGGPRDAVAESTPDLAWASLPSLRGFDRVRAGFTHEGGQDLALSVTGYRWPVEGRPLSRQDVASMWPLLRTAPDCLVAVPTADIAESMEWLPISESVALVMNEIAEHADPVGASFACLTSGEYSGHLFSVRVPGLLVGVKLRAETDVQTLTTGILDRLSAEQGKGYIPCRADIDGQSVITIGDARSDAAKLIPLEELPAVAEWGGWLLLSSNARVLSHLLEVAGPSSEISPDALPPMPPWATELTTGSLCAYAWVDTQATCAAVRNAIAVYELSLLVKRSKGSRAARARLGPIKSALDYVEPIGEAVLRCERDGSSLPRSTLRLSHRGE